MLLLDILAILIVTQQYSKLIYEGVILPFSIVTPAAAVLLSMCFPSISRIVFCAKECLNHVMFATS